MSNSGMKLISTSATAASEPSKPARNSRRTQPAPRATHQLERAARQQRANADLPGEVAGVLQVEARPPGLLKSRREHEQRDPERARRVEPQRHRGHVAAADPPASRRANSV